MVYYVCFKCSTFALQMQILYDVKFDVDFSFAIHLICLLMFSEVPFNVLYLLYYSSHKEIIN